MSKRKGESPLIHPYISFLTSKVADIHDALALRRYEDVIWRVGTLGMFLEPEDFDELKPVLRKVGWVDTTVVGIKDIDEPSTMWNRRMARHSLSRGMVEDLIASLMKVLFRNGYFTPQKYGIKPTADDRHSGKGKRPGFAVELPSDVR